VADDADFRSRVPGNSQFTARGNLERGTGDRASLSSLQQSYPTSSNLSPFPLILAFMALRIVA